MGSTSVCNALTRMYIMALQYNYTSIIVVTIQSAEIFPGEKWLN